MSAQTGKGFGLLFEMGCGKTLTAIAITGAGYQMGRINRVLVVAPTSVCAVWPKEFQEYADFRYTVKTLLGTKAQRLKQLDDLERFPFQALKVAVINYESVWRDGIAERLMAYDADLIIADESQRIKTHDANQSKAMHLLGDKARYKLILSGTPVQNEAMDIFSQYRFLDPTVFGTNYYAFRGRYAVMGGFNRKQVVAYRDLDQLIKKGGHPSDLENLQLAHWMCNRQKSDKISKNTQATQDIGVLSNRVLPQSCDWTRYRAK